MTFTKSEQSKHRKAFIDECRQKAWEAACHADWISKGVDDIMAHYQKLQAEDRQLEENIKVMETAFDYHTVDNRNKRKSMQERRNTLAQQMKLIGQNAQQGQQSLQQLYASMESNLALAKHARRSGSGRTKVILFDRIVTTGAAPVKDIAKTALMPLALMGLVAVLLEVFLSETQKNKINNLVLNCWNILDDLKNRRLLDWVQTRRGWFVSISVLLAVAFVLPSELEMVRRTGRIGLTEIVVSMVIFGPGLWFGFTLSRWTLRAKTLFFAVVKATVFIASTYVLFDLLLLIEDKFALPILLSITNPTLGARVALLIMFTTLAAMFFYILSIMFWLPIAISLILVYLASTIIFIAEFVMRRLAEYPKGALIAIAIILTAFVALLKALG